MSTENASEIPKAEEAPRLRVALTLVGREFSRAYMLSLVTTLHALWENEKIQVIISPGVDDNSTHQRMRAWGIPPQMALKRRLPLDGGFDVLVSLGSNVVFRPDQLLEMIDWCVREYPVVAGVVRGPTMDHVQVTDKLDVADLVTKDHFDYWPVERVQKLQDVLQKKQEEKVPFEKSEVFFPVEFASLDFMVIRRDVFEAPALQDSPLFFAAPASYVRKVRVKGGEDEEEQEVELAGQYMYTEDEAFCLNLRRAGVPLHLHVGMTVGVEKAVVL